MPLSTGQMLENRYRIVKLLATGGFGAVYRAWDTRLNRACALKENLDLSPEAARQFAKEAAILADLHHPNLPRVIDHFTVPGQGQYLVMDYVDGEDLQDKLDQHGALPEDQIIPWLAQICDALEYLHSQTPPVIHRDVKPANIKITPKGCPMLVDFGIAKVFNPSLRTSRGARAVTPGYSPPEQYGQGRTDHRSDIYALGATLYAMLTGQEPADSVQSLIGAVALVPPEQINPDIRDPIAQAILQAMHTDPNQRFQSAAEFKAAITQEEAPQPSRPAVTMAQPAGSTDPVAGAATPAAPPVPVRSPDQIRKTVTRWAVVTLTLGALSWIFGCLHPILMVMLEDPLGLDSGTLMPPCIVGFCIGAASAPVALVMGTMTLNKRSGPVSSGARLMTILGMLAGGALILSIIALLIFGIIFVVALPS